MQLSVKERLILGSNLPQQGDFITMTLAEGLKKKLVFTEEEITASELKPITEVKLVEGKPVEINKLAWNLATPDYDIPLGPKTVEMVKAHLKKLEGDAKLTADMLTLYEKFVGKIVVED